jgi:glycosyltransferase involved in cell wall biosynthesis
LYDRFLGPAELGGISALIALQESERQQAMAHGVPDDRIEIIPLGIDPHARETLPPRGSFRRRYGLDPNRPLVLFLARNNKIKGMDMLIEAFARLRRADVHLAIAGPDDGQLAEARTLIEQQGLHQQVTMLGLLPGPEVLPALQDADLFVLPSRKDAFPVTIMEACLVGTPMVVTDRCEIAHLVRDRIADVVPFDADAFASAIDRLLTDRERYERYRANCEAMIADTFSIAAVVDRLEAVYRRVIAEGRKNGQPS